MARTKKAEKATFMGVRSTAETLTIETISTPSVRIETLGAEVEVKSMVINYPAAAAIRRTGNLLILQSGGSIQKMKISPSDKVTCEVTVMRMPVENKMVIAPEEAK